MFEPEYVSKMNFYLNAVDDSSASVTTARASGSSAPGRYETIARLALHRVYSPIAVSTWQTATEPKHLPAPEPTDEPSDIGELAELDRVCDRLIERVS